MSVNNMNFEDSSVILNAIYEQVTGIKQSEPLDESAFVSMGNTLLKQGYDKLATGVSVVLSKTVYAIREYSGTFPTIYKDRIEWGGIVRKIIPLDTFELSEDVQYKLTDNESIDQWKIKKQKAIQLNFYGGNAYSGYTTITKNQLKEAFNSSAEFGTFFASQMTNIYNQIKQHKEDEARNCLLNFIGAKKKLNNNVIHLLDEYQKDTGVSLNDKSEVYLKDNFIPFAQWLYAYLETLIAFMGERSTLYHFNIKKYQGADIKPLQKFSKYKDIRIFMLTKLLKNINATVLASVYHDDKLSLKKFESVNFWQTITDPEHINVVPNYLNENGEVVENDKKAVNTSDVIGVIFDKDAMGVTVQDEEQDTTPFNARGKYWDIWFNYRNRWFNDITENGVILELNHDPNKKPE